MTDFLTTRIKVDAFIAALYAGKERRRPQIAEGWIERLQTRKSLPIVLPMEVTSQGRRRLRLVLLASDAAQFRQISNQFQAFLGKSYSGEVVTPRPKANYPYISEHCGEDCFFAAPLLNEENSVLAEAALVRWLQVANDEDKISFAKIKQTTEERLNDGLRRFYQALAAQDRDAASAARVHLQDKGLLDSRNSLFLDVQFFAAFREWAALLGERKLLDLIPLKRPAAVTEAFLRALYHEKLEPVADNFDALLTAFRDDVYNAFRPLFRSRGGLTAPEVLCCFMLRAIAPPDERDDALRDELLSLEGIEESERAYLRRLAYHADGQTEIVNIEIAKTETVKTPPYIPSPFAPSLPDVEEAIYAGREDAAQRLLRLVPPGAAKFQRAVWFAEREDTLTARSLALTSLNELPKAEKQRLLAVPPIQDELRRLLRQPLSPPAETETPSTLPLITEETLPPALPGDWSEWLTALGDGDLSDTILLDCAAQGVAEWSPLPLHNPRAAAIFAEKLGSVRDNENTKRLLVQSLPLLIRAVLEEPGYPRRAFDPIYHELGLTLLFDRTDQEGVTAPDLDMYRDLCAGQMAGGLGTGRERYNDLLSGIAYLWGQGGAINARPLLDLLDLFLEFPAPDKEGRARVAQSAFAQVSVWLSAGRLNDTMEEYARRLAQEFQCDALLPPPTPLDEESGEEKPDWNRLSGKTVGIYTLMESTGNRVKSLITGLCPRATIELNAEKDGSPTLENFAKRADILLLITGCAKHAATEFIERHRPSQKPLLRPVGRGSSSVLTALGAYLLNDSAPGNETDKTPNASVKRRPASSVTSRKSQGR